MCFAFQIKIYHTSQDVLALKSGLNLAMLGLVSVRVNQLLYFSKHVDYMDSCTLGTFHDWTNWYHLHGTISMADQLCKKHPTHTHFRKAKLTVIQYCYVINFSEVEIKLLVGFILMSNAGTAEYITSCLLAGKQFWNIAATGNIARC